MWTSTSTDLPCIMCPLLLQPPLSCGRVLWTAPNSIEDTTISGVARGDVRGGPPRAALLGGGKISLILKN